VLFTDNAKQQQLIKSLHKGLGENDAEFDDEDDDPLLRRIRRECEKRVKDCEERLKQSQAERHRQAMLLDKANKDLTDARGEADDAQRGAITMFNEQKRYKSHIQRLQSDVHRANSAVEKMRMKNQVVRDEKANLQRQFDNADYTILDLRSLLERRNQELNVLEQSVATTQDERTRLQLHSNEMTTSLVAIRQELEESRASATLPTLTADAIAHHSSSFNWGYHEQHSLCTTLFKSINKTAHKRAARSRILPCRLTGRPRVCRTDADHVR
jgi:chromosome segregation ATPase